MKEKSKYEKYGIYYLIEHDENHEDIEIRLSGTKARCEQYKKILNNKHPKMDLRIAKVI
jgi:hypothetical protein